MPKIFFTGGGTAGHVTPNIALIEALQAIDWECQYVGSKKGIERELIEPLGISFLSIQSGKLRRYFSWQNFIDPLFIVVGILQSLWLCLKHRPNVVFSKGGFVAVPVVFAAWLCRIPVISHESDITPGLANKLCLPFSQVLCVNFKQTLQYLSASDNAKARVTGSPLRSVLLNTSAERGRTHLKLKNDMPILLIVGGSLGAKVLNECVWQNLAWLTQRYQLVHLVGAGNQNTSASHPDYHQFEYLSSEYGDVLACADVVLSRAGANSIFELLTFRKPHVLVPLSAQASRGDQIINARIMTQSGFSLSIAEEDLTSGSLQDALERLAVDESFVTHMNELPDSDATSTIKGIIQEQVR